MIQRKPKICIDCQEMKLIWAHKRCQTCDGKYRSKNTKPKPRKAIKQKYNPTGEKEVFEKIALERPHECYVTGEVIKHLGISNCAHVLSKKSAPLFRLNPDNIQFLSFKAHYLYDFGTKKQREDFGYSEGWEKLYLLKEKLREEYKELEKTLKLI